MDQPAHVTTRSVKAHARDTFGSGMKAQQWLSRRNPLFEGKPPLQVLKTNPVPVETELTRIDHGVYV
jgi:uncharacterized protein (DUF2384 family)